MNIFFQRFLSAYKPFKKWVILSFVLMITGELFMVLMPYIYGEVINTLIAKAPFEGVVTLIAVAVSLFLLNEVVGFVQERVDIKHIFFDVPNHLSRLTLSKVLGLSVGQHRSQSSGMTQSVIARGQNSMFQLGNLFLYEFVPNALQLIIATGAVFFVDVKIGFIVVFFIVVYLGLSHWMNFHMIPKMKKTQDMGHDNSRFYSEIIRNLPLVQLNAQEGRIKDEYLREVVKQTDLSKSMWMWFMALATVRSSILGIGKYGIILLVGWGIYQGDHLAGSLVTLLMWVERSFATLGVLGRLQRQVVDYVIATNKYLAILDIEPEVMEIDNPVRPVIRGEIEFRSVSFRYDTVGYFEEKKEDSIRHAVRDVSFHIRAGERVAFVGESGAGKSTIINLILRAYDASSGQVRVDGEDIRVLDLRYYREHIGYVEQNVALFDNTLRYNMLFGLTDKHGPVSDEKAQELLEMSGISRFKERLTHGLDTKIGENGVQLSGGERQRVGIARALAKNPKILILDEATSNLDALNEEIIKNSIEEASKGRTTILIAHRLSTVKTADRIYVVDKGTVVAEGKHEELMLKSSVYANLVRTQLMS